MSADYRILSNHGVIYIRQSGEMRVDDTVAMMARMWADPEFSPEMKHLFDVSQVTGWSSDVTGLLAHQARETDIYDNPLQPTLVACLAPTPETQTIARIIARFWDGSARVVVRIVASEKEALAVLGLKAGSLAALLQTA